MPKKKKEMYLLSLEHLAWMVYTGSAIGTCLTIFVLGVLPGPDPVSGLAVWITVAVGIAIQQGWARLRKFPDPFERIEVEYDGT